MDQYIALNNPIIKAYLNLNKTKLKKSIYENNINIYNKYESIKNDI